MTRSWAADDLSQGHGRRMSAVSMLRRAGYGFGPARPASRGTGAVPQAAPDGPDSYPPAGSRLGRQLIFFAIIAYFVLIPAVAAVWRHVTPATLFVLVGVVAFSTLATWIVLLPVRPGIRGVPWVWLTVIVGLGIALFVVGGDQGGLLAVLAVAAPWACPVTWMPCWPGRSGKASPTWSGTPARPAWPSP